MGDFMELIVHIGQGKTGSTSIQSALKQSHDELISHQRVKYLGLQFETCNIKLYCWQVEEPWKMLTQKPSEKAISEILHLLTSIIETEKANGTKKLIWSNESLFDHIDIVEPVLSKIQNSGVKVNVILYLRKSDDWAQSAFIQWGIKHKTYSGQIQNFSKWIKRDLSLLTKIDKLQNSLNLPINIRNFENLDCVLTDFCKIVDISINSGENTRDNMSPGNAAIGLWALYNNQFEEQILPNDLYPLLSSSNVLNKKYKGIKFENLFATQHDIDQINEIYLNDSEKVNNYLKLNGQPPFSNAPAQVKDHNINLEVIMAGLLDICKSNYDEIQSLKKQVQELKNK